MDRKHPHGEAKNILEFNEGKPIINQETLDSIFDHEDVKYRRIVAFSIIGAYRKGKSFFLGYCLRYLYANVSINRGFWVHSLHVFCFPVQVNKLP